MAEKKNDAQTVLGREEIPITRNVSVKNVEVWDMFWFKMAMHLQAVQAIPPLTAKTKRTNKGYW